MSVIPRAPSCIYYGYSTDYCVADAVNMGFITYLPVVSRHPVFVTGVILSRFTKTIAFEVVIMM